MSARIKLGLLAGLALLAAAAFWYSKARFQARSGGRFDYAAAFEANDEQSTTPLIRLADIAGKTPEELRAALGAPESCEASLYSSRCRYAPGRTEVVFIEGKADWITVNELGETAFAPAALGRVGLLASAVPQTAEHELVWHRLAGLEEVRIEADSAGDRVEFIRVKVHTP